MAKTPKTPTGKRNKARLLHKSATALEQRATLQEKREQKKRSKKGCKLVQVCNRKRSKKVKPGVE